MINIDLHVIGIVLSTLFYEATGLVAGGLIAPAFLALYTFPQVVAVFANALITFFIVRLLSCRVILYGKRKFTMSVLVSVCIRYVFMQIPMLNFAATGIGFIVPALIAGNFDRQGIPKTMLAVFIVTFVLKMIWLFFVNSRGVL